MLKGKKPSEIWKNTNRFPEPTKVQNTVDKTISKFFGIFGSTSTKREKLLFGNRIFNSTHVSSTKKYPPVIISPSLHEIVTKQLAINGTAFELFFQYFIEKYGKIDITIVPAEIDFNHKVDFILNHLGIKIGFDVGIGKNVFSKRKDILRHSKNIDTTKKSSIKNKYKKNLIKKRNEIPISLDYFSTIFIHHTNGIITINPDGYLSKKLVQHEQNNNNILLEAYNLFIENGGKKDIEDYLPEKAKDEFIKISLVFSEVMKNIILFLSHEKLSHKSYELEKSNGTIYIQHNSDTNTLTINILGGKQNELYLSLYIPITKTLLKNIKG